MSARQAVLEALIDSFDPDDLPSLHKISAMADELFDALKVNGYAVVETASADYLETHGQTISEEYREVYEHRKAAAERDSEER